MNHRYLHFGWLFAALSVAGGCGGSAVQCYPVSGMVTVQQRPVAGAVVIFHPSTDHPQVKSLRPYATTDSSGRFTLNCLFEGDGAPVGDYAVTIVWEAADPHTDASQDPESTEAVADRLQGKYSDPATSGLSATVVRGNNELPPFAL